MITKTFLLHVDASLYNYRFSDAQFVEVSCTVFPSGRIQVDSIGIAPYLLLELIDMAALVDQARQAAKNNSKSRLEPEDSNLLF